MDTIQIKINQASNVRMRSKTYTLYEVRVETNLARPWLLHKRYREFETLHQALKQCRAQTGFKTPLPEFPPKRFHQRLHPENVEFRRVQLERFLQGCLKIPDCAKFPELLDFLSIPETIRTTWRPTDRGVNQRDTGTFNDPADRNSKQLSSEQKEILKLLRQMSLGQHKVRAIKEFSDYFFVNRPRLNPTDIDMLLKGNEKHPGIIRNCGSYYYSKVSRRAALELLVTLVDIEMCKDATNFLDRFCALPDNVLKELSLENHITSMNNQELAYKLLRIIKRRKAKFVNTLLPDVLKQQYQLWDRLQGDGPLPRQGREHKESAEVEAENPAETGRSLEAIGESAFDTIKNIFTDAKDWKVAQLRDPRKVGVKCLYKSSSKEETKEPETWGMKAVLKGVPGSPAAVLKELRNNKGKPYSCKCLKAGVVKGHDESHRLVYHVYAKPAHSADSQKQRDFCLLECVREEEDATWMVFTSVQHREYPEQKGLIRTLSKPCGWKISPTKGSKGTRSDVVWIADLTGETVLLVSPDLLGDSDNLVKFFESLGTTKRKSDKWEL